VRTGLVVVGLVLALVGVGVALSGFLLPTNNSSTEVRLSSLSAPNIASEQTRVALISMVNASSGTLQVTWSASHVLQVAVYQGTPCSAPARYCPSGAPLVNWPSNASGTWNRTGQLTFPYLLSMTNLQVANATLRGTVVESFTVGGNSIATWIVVTILVGGLLLVSIGALAVFLGLFLRGGVYTEPESVPPRYAHELDRPGDPLDWPVDDDEPVGGPGSPPSH
jgi:hypothetical protein